jgi:hypothetical protein
MRSADVAVSTTLGVSRVGALLLLVFCLAAPCFPQSDPALLTYFKEYVGLNEDQIASIRAGNAFAKTLPSRVPDEVFVFGAVYIHASPESYVQLSRDYQRLRSISGFVAIQGLSDPPQLSDVRDLKFDSEDLKELKNCRPGDCEIQMPGSAIEDVNRLVDWSAPNAADQVNQLLQKHLMDRLAAYKREGNAALGTYNDKKNPTQVAEQFQYILSYSKAFPRYLPDFYNYLQTYPSGRPGSVEERMYWAKVKFGLKPTLRVVQVFTMGQNNPGEPAYTIAETQLYSSHYFESALDLTFCVRDPAGQDTTGFYLIKAMGSEQAGLTGFKGSIIRKVAVDRSATSLQKSLAAIRSALEGKP